MREALLIGLAVLVAAAVGMQVWMIRAGRGGGQGSRMAASLRVFNIVLLSGVFAFILYLVVRA